MTSTIQFASGPVAASEAATAQYVPPPCPICAGPGNPCFISGPHKMYRCAECRTAFVAPMPSPEYLADFYSNYHVGTNYACEEKMQAHHPRQLADVRKFTGGSPGRILDVGCGKGHFLRHVADEGIDCAGVELSDTGAEYARRELRLNVLQGNIGDRKSELGHFDTVTLWGVIEHLANPVQVLRDAADVLRPGGHLFLHTGIGDDWFDRLLPGVNQWYDPPQHLFVFSAPGLRRCMAEAGFDTIHLDPAYHGSLTNRIIRRVRCAVVGTGLRVVCTLGGVRGGEFAMTRFPVGNHMLGVGKKR